MIYYEEENLDFKKAKRRNPRKNRAGLCYMVYIEKKKVEV